MAPEERLPVKLYVFPRYPASEISFSSDTFPFRPVIVESRSAFCISAQSPPSCPFVYEITYIPDELANTNVGGESELCVGLPGNIALNPPFASENGVH